jgi:protocatechuate 3,4-dioxygenase, alpha subunit
MSDPGDLRATPSQTVGPFFAFGLTTNAGLASLVRDPNAQGKLTLRLRVLDGDGAPVPDAMIEICHPGGDGQPGGDNGGVRGFGRAGTDNAGACAFETLKPRATAGSDGHEAAHLNLCIFMRGLMRHIYTRVYFAGDRDLSDDRVLALVPEDRRHTLIAQPIRDAANEWTVDIHLQGDQETVFFDL